ncbi:nucleoside-diphosphate-sugar epimerase [Filimonas zeae]|uniref:NAD-dependent epimerase/dehydratase domain-containing protein n=1 Tax=Filimonas zeae TaxID=1737353 RepID=A0A917IW65_9BACT|nr:hypothetical protein [Filimonas zeae]MDR6339237.1 nucleoside-diphosphate-sugar epimerase [Filimonas zeae]GGH64487.1 hypothetical protein GCM10011379_16590 [Filimonas zeae]
MEVQSDYVILSGGSGIGYAFAMHLLSENIAFTLFVQSDEYVAQQLRCSPLVSLVYGSYEDPVALTGAVRHKKYVFMGRCSRRLMPLKHYAILMANIISIAVRHRLLLIYPGNICQYEGGMLITKKTLPRPVTALGDLETQMEDLLLQAAVELQCRVMIVRIPVLWGPNATDREIEQLFLPGRRKMPVCFPVNADVLIPFAYAGDVAAFIFRMIQIDAALPFRVFHYAGGVRLTVRGFRDLISHVTGIKRKIIVLSSWQIYLLTLFCRNRLAVRWRLNCFSTSYQLHASLEEEQPVLQNSSSWMEPVRETIKYYSAHYDKSQR